MSDSNQKTQAEAAKDAAQARPPAREQGLVASHEGETPAARYAGRAMSSAGGGSPQSPPSDYGALVGKMRGSASAQASVLRRLQRGYGNNYVGQVIQRKAAGPHADASHSPEEVLQQLPSGDAGRALEPRERVPLESRLGVELGGVRVHDDGPAADAARALDAEAFTVGRDIYFGHERFKPATQEGRKLLAHELTHVAQRQKGAAPPTGSLVSSPDSAAEREAERVSEASEGSGRASLGAPPAARVQRQGKPPAQKAPEPTPQKTPEPPAQKTPDPTPQQQNADPANAAAPPTAPAPAPPAPMSLEQVVTLYDASIAQVEALQQAHSDLALDGLVLDLGTERDALKGDPSSLPEAQAQITRHDRIRAQVAKALPSIDLLRKGDYPDAPKATLLARLDEIRAAYAQSLSLSLEPAADGVFNEADKAMRFFPPFMKLTLLEHWLEEVKEIRRNYYKQIAGEEDVKSGNYEQLETEVLTGKALEAARRMLEDAYERDDADPKAAADMVLKMEKGLKHVPLGLEISGEMEKAIHFQQVLYRSKSAYLPAAQVAMGRVAELIKRLADVQEKFLSGDKTADDEFRKLTGSPQYKEFYAEWSRFIQFGEVAVNLYMIQLSMVTGSGVGGAMSGAVGLETGFALTAGNAARAGGVAVAESLAFTLTTRGMGYTGEEAKDFGKFGGDLAKEVAWNAALFAGMRGIARHFALSGKALGEMKNLDPKELARLEKLLKLKNVGADFAALEAFGLLRQGAEKGTKMTAAEGAQMTVENVVFMVVLSIAGKAGRPVFVEMKDAQANSRFLKIFGKEIELLQARQNKLGERASKLIEEGGVTEESAGALAKERAAIDAEIRRIVNDATTKFDFSPKHFEPVLEQLTASSQTVEFAQFTSDAKIQSVGADSYSYEHMTGERVRRYYEGRGATVEETDTGGGRGLKVTLNGEVIILIERPPVRLEKALVTDPKGGELPPEDIAGDMLAEHKNLSAVRNSFAQEGVVLQEDPKMASEADTSYIRITSPDGTTSFVRVIIRYNPRKCTIQNMSHEVRHLRDFQSGVVEPNYRARAKDAKTYQELQNKSAAEAKKYASENSVPYASRPLPEAAEFQAGRFLAEVSTHLADIELASTEKPGGETGLNTNILVPYEPMPGHRTYMPLVELETMNVKGYVAKLARMLESGEVLGRPGEVLNESQRALLKDHVRGQLSTSHATLGERYRKLVGGSLEGGLGL
jgi:Domain of unknown function (DUF4157)